MRGGKYPCISYQLQANDRQGAVSGEGSVWEFKSVLGGSSFFGEVKFSFYPPSLTLPLPLLLLCSLLQSITRSTWPRHQTNTGLLLSSFFNYQGLRDKINMKTFCAYLCICVCHKYRSGWVNEKNYPNSTKTCFLMRKLKNKTSEKSIM